MDDLPPSTTGQNWDGTTASAFGGGNETVSLVFFLGNGTGSDVTNVTIEMGSFTKAGTDGIVSVEVSSGNVWDYSQRPITSYFARYVPVLGLTQLSWDATEYDQYHLPSRWQLPCTVSAGQCSADGGTTWADREDHDKWYPDALIPWESVKHSSFTVYSSSSQAVWVDVYISTDLATGVYTSEFVVYEGVSVSTRIPVNLTVRNYSLPDVPALKVMAYVSDYNTSYRHHGEHFPNKETEPYMQTRKRYYQELHRHGISPIGNDNTVTDVPYSEHIQMMDGSLYSPTTGYGNARGVLTGDTIYSIGTYGSWQGAWGTSDASAVCSHVSNYKDWLKANEPNVNAFLYLTDEPADLTDTNTWSTWLTTATACQVADYNNLQSFVTARWTSVQSGAPNVMNPSTTDWIGVSSETWQTSDDWFNDTLSSSTPSGYNAHPPWSGIVFAIEEGGTGPLATMWGMYKKSVPLWFFWETTYFNDSNNDDNENVLLEDPMTFGYYTSDSETKGRTGFGYSNLDGLLMYPGRDVIFSSYSYTADAAFPSWRLKMIRRGIQDGDYLTQASAIDSAGTSVIAESMVPTILWEYECYDTGDCSYTRGPNTWPENQDSWEIARSNLADILESSSSSTASPTVQTQGSVTFSGGVDFQ